MENLKVYKCNICGNIVVKLEDKTEALFCCGEPMELLEVQTEEGLGEKHIPVFEKEEIDGGFKIKVKVGSIMHPMDNSHYISHIIVETENGFNVKCLNPGENPEAEFLINEDIKAIYEYCTIHGLWRA